MFITLEGPDGSGKTTQVEHLSKRLRNQTTGDVLHLTFPSKSPAGTAARKLLHFDNLFNDPLDSHLPAIVLQSVMIADRYNFVGSIEACLRFGGIVIVERWTESGIVYGGEDGLNLDWLTAAQASLPKPDLRILLHVDIDTIMSRLQARGDPTERYEQRGFQQKIIARYQNVWACGQASKIGSREWKIVDGRAPTQAVSDAIYGLIVERSRDMATL